METRKNLGQYFTTNDKLQQFIFDSVKNKCSLLLEPSFGSGHLLKKFLEYDQNYPMICCEIDKTIPQIVKFNEHQKIIYDDFLTQSIDGKFKTIIGNPPYVKQSTGNLYLEFINLCVDYLDDGGELIFIVPSDFTKVTRANGIIKKMTSLGSFTNFLFPNDEKLFDEANIDICVFRYQLGLIDNNTIVNGKKTNYVVNDGILTFNNSGKENSVLIGDLFDIYVGLVSGRDEVYHVPYGNIDILIDENKIEKFIFAESFPTGNKKIDKQLETNKDILLSRRIKKFSEKNWFLWGAPRNKKHIEENSGKPCIYIKNITRRKKVAFLSTVMYFGGSLLCMIPKNDMDIDLLKNIVNLINSDSFQENYIYSGRFKIGQKQLCNATINIV